MRQSKQNHKQIIVVIVSMIMTIALTACVPVMQYYPAAGTGEYRLPVFETSDIHGALSQDVDGSNAYMVSYIADKVNDARRTEDGIDLRRAILLDGGDIYQGTAVSLLTDGEAMSAVFDEMEYDAVALGNHEFDWGIDTAIDKDGSMRDHTEAGGLVKNEIPVVCCNLYKDGEKVDFVRDYVILEKIAVSADGKKKRARIAVIGFAEDYKDSIPEKEFKDLGYAIICDYDSVNEMAKDLEDTKGCDATILLAHGAADEIAEGLGPQSPVDLVLGGHEHLNKCDETSWGLRYLAPAGNAKAYAYDELVFENDGKGGLRIKDGADTGAAYFYLCEKGKQETLIPKEGNENEFDRGIIDITDEYLLKAEPILATEIGYITEPVTKDPIEGTDNRITTAGNFVCDAMLSGADVDVAFINKSGYRTELNITGGKDRRKVTEGDMFAMLPFDDRLYCYEITYKEFKDVLDFSLNDGYSLLTCMTGIDCYFIDDPEDNSGGEYPKKLIDALVKDDMLIFYQGKWREGWDEKKVRITANDYAATPEESSSGESNPLFGYNETDRLLSDDLIQRTCVINALKEAAAQNDGHLDVDGEPHFLYKAYDGDDTIDE